MQTVNNQTIEALKASGHFFAAGALAAQLKAARVYGCHVGMRSTKDRDQAEFYRGFDAALAGER